MHYLHALGLLLTRICFTLNIRIVLFVTPIDNLFKKTNFDFQ